MNSFPTESRLHRLPSRENPFRNGVDHGNPQQRFAAVRLSVFIALDLLERLGEAAFFVGFRSGHFQFEDNMTVRSVELEIASTKRIVAFHLYSKSRPVQEHLKKRSAVSLFVDRMRLIIERHEDIVDHGHDFLRRRVEKYVPRAFWPAPAVCNRRPRRTQRRCRRSLAFSGRSAEDSAAARTPGESAASKERSERSDLPFSFVGLVDGKIPAKSSDRRRPRERPYRSEILRVRPDDEPSFAHKKTTGATRSKHDAPLAFGIRIPAGPDRSVVNRDNQRRIFLPRPRESC